VNFWFSNLVVKHPFYFLEFIFDANDSKTGSLQ